VKLRSDFMTDKGGKKDDNALNPASKSRRGFLKVAMTISTLLAIGGIAALIKSMASPALPSRGTPGLKQFPRVKIAQISDLQPNRPLTFNYPLDNEPNVLVKLGEKADGGVGPEGDIVAFSSICQHLGCIYGFQAAGTSPGCNLSYKADGPKGYCCCHGTVYDFLHRAKVISGPSPRPQPLVILEVDSAGNIFAVGMGPPTIFGHNTGSDDVSADLEGGNQVG
jgi:arsenite oxidase small subunit